MVDRGEKGGVSKRRQRSWAMGWRCCTILPVLTVFVWIEDQKEVEREKDPYFANFEIYDQ